MLILVLAMVAMSLIWLFAMRTEPVNPFIRRAAIGFAVACVCAALAVRAGPALGLLLVAVMLLAVWLRLRRRDDDGPGGDGPDPPVEPGPDPGPGHEVLDQETFDRARAEWEQELRKP